MPVLVERAREAPRHQIPCDTRRFRFWGGLEQEPGAINGRIGSPPASTAFDAFAKAEKADIALSAKGAMRTLTSCEGEGPRMRGHAERNARSHLHNTITASTVLLECRIARCRRDTATSMKLCVWGCFTQPPVRPATEINNAKEWAESPRRTRIRAGALTSRWNPQGRQQRRRALQWLQNHCIPCGVAKIAAISKGCNCSDLVVAASAVSQGGWDCGQVP